MKPIHKFTILVFTFLTLAASSFAQESSPREQFQTAVTNYQKSGTEDNALKLAELYKQLDPPPAIPADAEYHAQKAAAFAELAKEPADFHRAVAEFEQAIQLAPWVGEYHYNTALMLKSKAGSSDLEAAMRSIKLARLLAKDDKEKRDATALSAKLEVALEVTRESVAKEAKLTAARKMEDEKINALIPGTAYLISTDGSEVTDQKTGLIWRRCVEGMVCSGGACSGEGREFNYEQALQRAKSEASRSGKAWRVPEAHELVGLVDKSRSPMINPTAFPAQPCTDGSYGSCAFRAATRSVEYPASHLVVSFRAGVGDDNTSSIVFDKYAFYLRLVRDGQ